MKCASLGSDLSFWLSRSGNGPPHLHFYCVPANACAVDPGTRLWKGISHHLRWPWPRPHSWNSGVLVLQSRAHELSGERVCPGGSFVQQVLHILSVKSCQPGTNNQYHSAHSVHFYAQVMMAICKAPQKYDIEFPLSLPSAYWHWTSDIRTHKDVLVAMNCEHHREKNQEESYFTDTSLFHSLVLHLINMLAFQEPSSASESLSSTSEILRRKAGAPPPLGTSFPWKAGKPH